MTPAQFSELDSGLRTLAEEVAHNTRVHRAGLQQWFSLSQLQERYALDAKQVRARISHHGIQSDDYGARGLRVYIDEVLRLDECLRPNGSPA